MTNTVVKATATIRRLATEARHLESVILRTARYHAAAYAPRVCPCPCCSYVRGQS